MTRKTRELDADLYPMNQDRIPFAALMYSNSLDIIAGYMSKNGVGVDEACGMVERDLRLLLDQKFHPQ